MFKTFLVKEKVIVFLKIKFFLLSECKYKAKYGEELKILTTIQCFKDYQFNLHK